MAEWNPNDKIKLDKIKRCKALNWIVELSNILKCRVYKTNLVLGLFFFTFRFIGLSQDPSRSLWSLSLNLSGK